MKNIDEKYKRFADDVAPPTPIFKNCVLAFLTGGLICAIGQGLQTLYFQYVVPSKEDAGLLCSVTLIFIAVLLTGIGIFDDIAKFAGAGTLVPITGFANSVASPAIDSRSEGLVLGIGAKIFTVAGPVILYGTLAGVIYGVIYWLFGII